MEGLSGRLRPNNSVEWLTARFGEVQLEILLDIRDLLKETLKDTH